MEKLIELQYCTVTKKSKNWYRIFECTKRLNKYGIF